MKAAKSIKGRGKATVSDPPAILHHSNIDIRSSLLDSRQVTSDDTLKSKPVDEQIRNLSMKLTFNRSAHAFTLEAMSDYFKDKMLDKVRFDTLRNKFGLADGALNHRHAGNV